jgi:lipopolysaccharide export LptBFGC system permease protein LptF
LYYLHPKIIVIFCIFALMIAILLHKIFNKLGPKFYLSQLKKNYKLAIEKNPNLVKEKEVTLKPNKLIVTIDNSGTEINFESIFKIVESNAKIYILNKKYQAFLIIPYEAFKDNDEKLDFLSGIKK